MRPRRLNLYNHRWNMSYVPASIDCSKLPGSFSLCLNDQKTACALSWRAVECPLEIADGRISLSSDGAELAAVEIWAGSFPPTPAGDLEIPFVPSKTFFPPEFPFSVDFTISLETCNKQEGQAILAARSAGSSLDRSPNNVCFNFPRSSRHLWANEDNLRELSSYYDLLLSSGFAEGSTSSQAVPSSSSHPEYTYDDSDAETDELELGWKLKSKKDEEQEPRHKKQRLNMELDGVPFKTVTIVDTAYTTYLAVLVWITTGYIRFAPLRSKVRSDNKGDARATELARMVNQSDLRLPPPTSPKSLYRLAHLLEIPDLVQLALDNFKSQLSPANIAYELYSDVSSSYEAIRDAALDLAVAQWKEVSKAAGTREMEQRAYAGELPKEAMGTIMLLARKLTEKYEGI
ncbi:hypothetical protein JCM1840_003372 [Sporobolomyces johnsonii]